MVVCEGVFSRPSSKCCDGGQRLLFVVLLCVLLVFPGLIALSRDTSIITNTRIALDRQSQDDVKKPRHEQVPLVTGCGPSGTMFVKELLEAHGIPALHEEMETGHVSVSWLYGAYNQSNIPFESEQSKALRTRLLKGGLQPFGPVVHLVRNPLDVISSVSRCFCGKGVLRGPGIKRDRMSWEFFETATSEEERMVVHDRLGSLDDRIRLGMEYYYRWNTMIRMNFPNATLIHSEYVSIDDLTMALNLPHRPRDPHPSPKDSGHAGRVTWLKLLSLDESMAEKVYEEARRYGYITSAEWKSTWAVHRMVSSSHSIVDAIAHTRVRINRVPLALSIFDWLVYSRGPIQQERGVRKRNATPKHVFCEAKAVSVNLLIQELDTIRDFHGSTLLIGGEDTHLSKLMHTTNLTKLVEYFDTVKYEAKDIPHETIDTFPMGLLPHYTQKHNEKNIREAIIRASIQDKPNLLIASWGKMQPGLNWLPSRVEAQSFVDNTPWISKASVEPRHWWKELRHYKFMLCPTGNGIQSPKFVEALLVLTIPIAQNVSAYHDLARQGFPILIVNQWEDLNPQYLEEQWELLSPKLSTARSYVGTDRWFEYVTSSAN
ncbi:hypothetical protein M9435_001329 [Picochlorum sp. BPE23]|nr:hypothetical protein M9435_001329 [Picochlorum sp. BPE23]